MKKMNRRMTHLPGLSAGERGFGVVAIVAAGFLLLPMAARADLLFFPGLGYTTQTEQVDGSKTVDSKLLDGDGRLGWLSGSSGLYIGGMYKYESGTDAGSESTISKVGATSLGPSIGFIAGGLTLIGTYFLQSNRDITDAGVLTSYKKGTGYQIDLAYLGGVSHDIFVGPQLSYRSIKYKQSSVAGITGDASYEIDSVQPTLAFLIKF